jgi:hypothetical protein
MRVDPAAPLRSGHRPGLHDEGRACFSRRLLHIRHAMNGDDGSMTTATAAIIYGPLGPWVGAGATVLIVVTTVLVSLGYFDALRGPRIRITFEATEPWCRHGATTAEGRALWVRIGVENVGGSAARGCVGRLISVATEGELRRDVDPVQLRWAGVPHSRAFNPIDLRRDQREYLNVLCLQTGHRWHLVTFEDPDFDPGFATHLSVDECHQVQISVFADNAHTATRTLVAEAGSSAEGQVRLHLL